MRSASVASRHTAVMDGKPLIAILVVTVIIAVLTILSLQPSASSGTAPGSLGQYQGAINAAQRAVSLANANGSGPTVSTVPAGP